MWKAVSTLQKCCKHTANMLRTHWENFKVMIILDNCFKETYRELYATFYCHPSLFSMYLCIYINRQSEVVNCTNLGGISCLPGIIHNPL